MKLEYYKCSKCKRLGHNKLTCKGGKYVINKKTKNGYIGRRIL